uniref:Uncharacterized protein n=1 Tax=Picea sitchensis TaxID=3332 RepID=D5ACZ4_PICSI|nr:unknown [Picea sitchensis]
MVSTTSTHSLSRYAVQPFRSMQSYSKATRKLPDFNIGSDHVEPDNHVQHIHSGTKLEKCVDHKLQEGDKVKVLDLYDIALVGIERIHSLYIIHGVKLSRSGDANVNIIKVTRNMPLPYDEKIEGYVHLKEME